MSRYSSHYPVVTFPHPFRPVKVEKLSLDLQELYGVVQTIMGRDYWRHPPDLELWVTVDEKGLRMFSADLNEMVMTLTPLQYALLRIEVQDRIYSSLAAARRGHFPDKWDYADEVDLRMRKALEDFQDPMLIMRRAQVGG